MWRISVEMVQISHLRISDLEMVSRNVDCKISSVFNIRDKSEELHNKSVFFAFIVVHRFVLFIQQK
jgi:hypothetical protein